MPNLSEYLPKGGDFSAVTATFLIYIRATTKPSTPTGGSVNTAVQSFRLSPPSGWTEAEPVGSDKLWQCYAVQTSGSLSVWSEPKEVI